MKGSPRDGPIELIEGSPDGNIWMLDPENSKLIVLGREKLEPIKAFGTKGNNIGELNTPIDFTFSKDGKMVFISDHYNYRIQAFSLDGEYLYHFGTEDSISGKTFVLPFGVTAGLDGFVYVTDVGAHKILKFTEEGELVDEWGQWGDEPGAFYKPKGIAQHSSGRLIVVDFGNHRAQIFDSEGVFETTFGIGDDVSANAERP